MDGSSRRGQVEVVNRMNRMGMSVRRVMTEGLVGVHSIFGNQLWDASKTRKSRNHPDGRKCALCKKHYPVGSKMWKEATQCSGQRMLRVCDPCMQDLIKNAE